MALDVERVSPTRTTGIGWDGRTVLEMLEESERLVEETGSYGGLTGDLELKSSDPIRYEKLFSRLRGGLTSARETAMNISASPIIKEIGELCFALYTPEGDSIALSTGIIVHVHTTSDAIKYMIRHVYEENPGIAPGDIFCNNDPMVGDVHNPDVQTILPIFWEGELVGWAGGITHELDVGATAPGGAPIGPISRFEDGIDLSARKVGSQDELWRDHVLASQRAVRTPMYWALDEKTRLTGCMMIREVVERVIQDEGIDTYKRFIREAIEDGRRAFKNRVRQMLVPGRYRAPSFGEVPFGDAVRMPAHARHDRLNHACLEIRLRRDGVLELDLDGTSSWGYHSFNATPSAMQGALWVQLTQTLMCHDKVNDGAYFAMKTNFPPGTLANHSNPHASMGAAWAFLIPAYMGFVKSLSRSFQARGFVEEVLAPYAMTANVMEGAGLNQYGQESAMTNFGFSCVGGGAKLVTDGLDYGAAMWNPEGDMGDMGIWEDMEPFLYLSQRVKPNTAGPGRHRGGSGYETLRLCWKTPFFEIANVATGLVRHQAGLWGGYPGATLYRHNVRGSNFLDLVEAERPFPVAEPDPGASAIESEIQGRRDFDRTTITMPEAMEHGDVFLNSFHGGCGLGDVLERRYEDVMADLDGGFLLERYAGSIYGVVPGDEDATEQLRATMRATRLERAKPTREWLAEERERVAGGDLSETLQRMYAESMRLSPRFAREFREFWSLPDDFEFDVATPEVDKAKAIVAAATEEGSTS